MQFVLFEPLVDVPQRDFAEVAKFEQVGAFIPNKVTDGDKFSAAQYIEDADAKILVLQLGIEDRESRSL